jgi:hypothetical protein
MTDSIDQLLSEVEMHDDPQLRALLIEFQSVATSVRPMPSPALAVLLAPERPSSVVRRHRGAITALIVVGTLGFGVTAAAASPEVRAAAQHILQTITGTVPPTTSSPVDGGGHGTSSSKPASTPSPATSDSPLKPAASAHPVPSDHPGNNSNNGAGTPIPARTYEPIPGNGHSTAVASDPGKSHKP